jgi:hypothetical protein
MGDTTLLQDTRVEPFVNRASNDAVTYPLIQDASEMVMVDGVKVTLNIDLPFAHFGSSFPRIGSLVLRNKELPMVFLSHCGQLPI